MFGNATPLMSSPSLPDELKPAAPVSARALHPAGFLRRSIAALIDGLALIALLIADYYLLVVALGWSVDRREAGATDLVFYLIAAVIGWLYCALGEGIAGRTPGKRLVGIVVRDRAGEVPGMGRATLRFAGRFATLATLLLGWLLILVTGRRQSLHDLIAGTVVVVDDRAPR